MGVMHCNGLFGGLSIVQREVDNVKDVCEYAAMCITGCFEHRLEISLP